MNFLTALTPSKTSQRLAAGLLLCAAAVSAFAQSVTRPRVMQADAIVAVVNDEVITRNELDERVRSIEKRMKASNQQVPSYSELRKIVLERMISDRAALQVAKENGIRVDDNYLDRTVARIAEQNRMSMQQFRDQVERDGISYSAFREEIREDIAMQRIREREVESRIQISQAEVDHYIEVESKGVAEQVELNLAQILVRVPENASPDQIAQRRARAEDVWRQLRSGGDFAKIAATYSDSPDGLKGGELGWRGKDRLPELFVEAVANLKPGQVSAIVRSPNGFHIVKLIDQRVSTVQKENPFKGTVQQTRARHILLKPNQVTSMEEAKKKLLDMKQRIKAKTATFEELAKIHSLDGSAARGGDLGWLYQGDTVPEFERAMDALAVGEISDPVESQFGLHMIEVLERKTEDVSIERQRLLARQVLRDRKLEEATQTWLREVRDRAYVEIREDR